MRGVLIALLLAIPLLSGLSVAHEPERFTVIVREDTHTPLVANLIVNDSVQYLNHDSRENITHEIGLDLNGDGDFNDTMNFPRVLSITNVIGLTTPIVGRDGLSSSTILLLSAITFFQIYFQMELKSRSD